MNLIIKIIAMETPQEYYERKRKLGLTDDITSNPDPDYNQPFYQNIFRLMECYAKLCDGKIVKSENGKLHIRDINGCWVVSNDERPTEDGIYTTIDSQGIEGETLFDNKHWIIRPYRNPVQMWLKPNCH